MTQSDHQRFGVIRVGNVRLGIPIEHFIEVFPVLSQTHLPNVSELLGGGIELRGRLIPLLNIAALVDPEAASGEEKLGVVVEHDGKLLAFYVREIVGIATIMPGDLDAIGDASRDDPSLFEAVFSHDGQFTSVLNTGRIFSLPGVFATDRAFASRAAEKTYRPPMMTFAAGTALYAVPAVEVFAAVPKQKIEETAITSGPCLGEIAYHGRRIPVMCPVSLLGLGHRERKSVSEVVVLRFPDDLVLGLAVDEIHDIRSYSTRSNGALPAWQGPENLIETVIVREDEAQIHAIDIDRFRALETVATIASLSATDQPDTSPDPQKSAAAEQSNVVFEQSKYLVVDVVERLAIRLLQVSYILDPPDRLTPATDAPPGFMGYFSRFGESVALIDLRMHLGHASAARGGSKVLLTGPKGHQVGFLVDAVVSIEQSQWRETTNPDAPTARGGVVQLGQGDTQTVLPCFDLDAICGLSEPAPGGSVPDLIAQMSDEAHVLV